MVQFSRQFFKNNFMADCMYLRAEIRKNVFSNASVLVEKWQ